VTPADVRSKGEAKRAEHARLGSLVSAATIIGDKLVALEEVDQSGHDQLRPTEATTATHYHTESICWLIRQGKVKNFGWSAHHRRVPKTQTPCLHRVQEIMTRRDGSRAVLARLDGDAG